MDEENASDGKDTVRFVCGRDMVVRVGMAVASGGDDMRMVLRILLMRVRRK